MHRKSECQEYMGGAPTRSATASISIEWVARAENDTGQGWRSNQGAIYVAPDRKQLLCSTLGRNIIPFVRITVALVLEMYY